MTSITAQQVSLQSAAAIRSRFIERFGVGYEHAYAFPTRERVAQATEAELVGVGFSNRKAEYVVGLARSELDLDGLAALPDEEVTRDGSWRCAGSASGRPTGSSPATWRGRMPGPPATWDCGRRWLRSMVTCPMFAPSPPASTPSRT